MESKLQSFRRNVSIAIREPAHTETDAEAEHPEPVVDVLPTPTVAEAEKVFEKELEELEKSKQHGS